MRLWAWQKVTAAKSIIPASSPLLGPLSRHWPGRYITQRRRTLGRNTSVGPRSHIVMSGCHSTQLISPNSLQGFRLAEVPGFVGMWCFLLLSQGVSEGGICVRPSPQIPGRRLSWERLYLGDANGTNTCPSIASHPSQHHRSRRPRSEAGVGPLCELLPTGNDGIYLKSHKLGVGTTCTSWKRSCLLSFQAKLCWWTWKKD